MHLQFLLLQSFCFPTSSFLPLSGFHCCELQGNKMKNLAYDHTTVSNQCICMHHVHLCFQIASLILGTCIYLDYQYLNLFQIQLQCGFKFIFERHFTEEKHKGLKICRRTLKSSSVLHWIAKWPSSRKQQ